MTLNVQQGKWVASIEVSFVVNAATLRYMGLIYKLIKFADYSSQINVTFFFQDTLYSYFECLYLSKNILQIMFITNEK